MAGSESIRERGRGGRTDGVRRSRRTQGMPPEEQLSLEEVERNARRTNAARRKAAREEKESTEAQDQPESEPAAQDAHHVSLDAVTPNDEEKGPPSGSEVNSTPGSEVEVVGVSIPDVSTQASVGGAVKVESSAVDRPSGTSRPAQDVIVLDVDSDESPSQARTIKGEGPLPAVQEEPASSLPNETPLPSSPVPNAAPDAPPRVATSEDPQNDSGEQASAARMKEFVADQVHSWERVTLEFVMSPTVDVVDSSHGDVPIRCGSFDDGLARSTMMHPSDNWISNWSLVRLSPCTAADATAAMIPMITLSLRECAALLQTLFFEAGLRFRNLIPQWFQARAPRVEPIMVRMLMQELQQQLADEHSEWRSVAAGVPNRVMPALDVHVGDAALDAVKEEHPDDDVPMSTREMDVLGRECLFRMRVAGVRPTRSPASSAVGRPESKRPQYGPPRPSSIPSMSSHLSYRSSIPASQDADALSARMSVTQSAVSRRSSGRESSLFGTTAADSEESNPSATSGSRSTEPYSSSGSSLWSLGGATGAHMPYAAPSGMVMTARSGSAPIQGGWGVQVAETVLPTPPVPVNQDDIEDVPEAHALPKVKPKQLFRQIQLGGRKAPWPPRIQAPSPSQAVAQSIREVRMDAMIRVDASVQEMKQQLQDKDNASDRKPEAADEGKRTFQTYQATQLLVDREDALENQCALDTQAPVQVIISEATTEKAREVVGAIQEDALKRAREAVKAERAQEEHLRSEAEAAKLQAQEATMQKTLEEQRRLLEEQQKLFDRRIALLEAA
ncbi:hypothetical protein PHYSODRAFT_322474 [Phytophthora sojae]|uniref:Uncharacterized protein n=1 Tax=Phytophthora sojae (strain P6497) TaxID=1094619 RepID=G4YKL8_PHYSP|nr:hypothetical protein PHYSODRAFT_322474 [Phytophthora sojae]EGZ28850.1 hypothetical protein PHYSODRAFT_322474 [Phytophthora sojae]|eukprot:XP_009516125.1 hypothetical protein PHYSODRAFT_322474 [Phytophthora sojae]